MARIIKPSHDREIIIGTDEDDGRIGKGRLGLRIPDPSYWTTMSRSQALELAAVLIKTVADLDPTLQQQ